MGALNSKPEKRARMTFRIRSVGPMTLANYTEQELTLLRQAVTRKNSKVKYLSLCKMDRDLQVPQAEFSPKLIFNKASCLQISTNKASCLQVVAQATDKLSSSAWREVLGHRLVIRPYASHSIEEFRKLQGSFEEYGLFGRPKPNEQVKTGEPATQVKPAEPVKPAAKKEPANPAMDIEKRIKMYQAMNALCIKRLKFFRLVDKLKSKVKPGILVRAERAYIIKTPPPLKTPGVLLNEIRERSLKRSRSYEVGDIITERVLLARKRRVQPAV
jgi:hypothetical protein